MTESYPTNLFSSAIEAAGDGMAISSSERAHKQLPTVALICGFKGPSDKKPSLLSFDEAKFTFFHEFGHAVHSLLGRTSLQNVSGTRCVADFSEFPSILTEYFFSNPSVLSLFARHWQTDAPIPLSLVDQHMRIDKLFSASRTERQILLSLLDQALYTRTPADLADSSFSAVNVYHDLQDRYTAIGRDPPGTSWPGFMGHLFGYGATYYSYLFDRAIAARVWKKVFSEGEAGGAVDRENGERLAREVLRFGGGRDPWKCVANVLGGEDAEVEEGGEKAMECVGGWGATR
jgi:intermediate peptidase